jgi:hypothetical protein
MKRKTSSGDNQHPYLKVNFWQNPTNHFWNSELYSEKSKDYFLKSVENMLVKERRDYLISQ